ncbi:MAG: hypothetical protein IPM98_12040 [Lewinellaceae bacterium]|nr:hypothetical protein [Lewinellaceae bacterium]
MKKILYLLPCLLCFFLLHQQTATAQGALLGIQGILKKANGNAVDDAAYSLKFRLYEQAEGGTHIWEETQIDVDVIGGIYTATLGSITPLNVPFDTTYYLGVSVGSGTEMLPRIRLTTAPYALSLIGNTNQFPSSGTVKEDNTIIAGKLAVGQSALPTTQSVQVNGGVLARGGVPGINGVNNNGYAFSGNSGDDDSGLFSPQNGYVALYTNGVERVLLYPTGMTLNGNLTMSSGNVFIGGGGKIIYGNSATTNADWRLVDTDVFADNEKQGWESTTGLLNATAGTTTLEDFTDYFHGWALRPDNESDWLKKQFTIDPNVVGAYTQVKIKFKYFFLDSWDAAGSEDTDLGIGAFSTDKNGTTMAFTWSQMGSVYDNGIEALDFYDGSSNYSDATTIGEMTMTRRNGTDISYWVFFGARMAGTDDESYAIGDIEVWVK